MSVLGPPSVDLTLQVARRWLRVFTVAELKNNPAGHWVRAAPKRRIRYSQPFASASFAASDRFLQPNFWIAFER